MKKRTLMVRANRLKFIRFLHTEYGMNMQTAYAKIRDWRVKEWELEGIANCIHEYDKKYRRPLDMFYQTLHRRQPFLDFMLGKGMCTKTGSIRFRNFDFTKIELAGLNEAYRVFQQREDTAAAETEKEQQAEAELAEHADMSDAFDTLAAGKHGMGRLVEAKNQK